MKTQMKTLRQDLILEDVEDSEGTPANAELRPRGVQLMAYTGQGPGC